MIAFMNTDPSQEMQDPARREPEVPPSFLPPDLPLPAFLAALDGRILSWNRPFQDLLEIPDSIQAPHLVRQDLLVNPASFLAEIREGLGMGTTRRLRMKALSGRPLELLAHLVPRATPDGDPLFLALLMDAGQWDRSERSLRAEIHHLEDLLQGTAREKTKEGFPWKDAARGLLECFPHKAILLDRHLRVLLPTQGEGGPPVLCARYLLGSPGACSECLAEKALLEGREIRIVMEGKRMGARPLPGGLVLEWVEEEGEEEAG